MPVMGLIALERRGVGSFIHSRRWGLFERVDAWESGCCEIQATGPRKGGIGAGRRISERESAPLHVHAYTYTTCFNTRQNAERDGRESSRGTRRERLTRVGECG